MAQDSSTPPPASHGQPNDLLSELKALQAARAVEDAILVELIRREKRAILDRLRGYRREIGAWAENSVNVPPLPRPRHTDVLEEIIRQAGPEGLTAAAVGERVFPNSVPPKCLPGALQALRRKNAVRLTGEPGARGGKYIHKCFF